MRIGGGVLKGRRWPVPVASGIRPTPARVREALFQILGVKLDEWTVLDATGGSGIMTAESLSRGASHVTVLERDPRALHAIGVALASLDLIDRVSLKKTDALRWKSAGRRYHLVFADPPYSANPQVWVERLWPCVGMWLVLEHDRRTTAPPHPECGRVPRPRRYGDTALTFYRQPG